MRRLTAWARPLRERVTRSRAWSAWLRVRGLVPLTASGLLAIVACAFLYRYLWVAHRDYVAYLAVCVVAAVMAWLLALTALGWWIVKRRIKTCRTLGDEAFETDRWQPSGYEFRFPAWLPCVQIDWKWETPRQVELRLRHRRGRIAEEVRPLRRGVHSDIRRRVSVSDIIGLWSFRWTVEESASVRVLPARGTLDQLALLSSLLSADEVSDPRGEPSGDRVDMRAYTSSDSPRMILWKVYARTRKLMVRVPERAITAQPRTCAYLLAGPADEATAGLAAVVLERGLLGDGWRFGADGSFETASQAVPALDILARSGNAPSSSNGSSLSSSDKDVTYSSVGFEAFAMRAERDGYSCCILFTPPGVVPAAEGVRNWLATSRMRVYVMAGFDPHKLRGAERHAWLRWVLRPTANDFVRLDELHNLVKFWRGANTEVVIADRQTGRFYTDPHTLLEAAR